MEIRLCLCSVPDTSTAQRLADLWLKRGWAACVTRIPGAISQFHWQGAMETTAETLLLIKTTSAGAGRIRGALPEDHPYDCPEWLEFSAVAAAEAYAAWIRDSITP